jgi:hypothetical protein
VSENPTDAHASTDPFPDLDPTAQALVDVVHRSYEATSSDGTVTAVARGDPLLASVDIEAYAPTLPALTQALNEAIRGSLARAQADTVKAMAEVPGLDPALAGLLRDGARR